jgi:hypothetical protein
MKKCPTCEKTFEDSMRFCQTDGTLLVDDAASEEAIDPYQTIVAPSDPLPVEEPVEDPYKTVVATPAESAAPDASGDLLQIPETPDPLKTMYASEDEIRREMAVDEPKEDPIFEVPPAAGESEPPAPEPPSFVEPELSAPVYGDSAPPPSPFSTGNAPSSPYAVFEDTGPQAGDSSEGETLIAPDAPIPSPFGERPPAPSYSSPESYSTPDYKEPEPPPANPFDQAFTPSAVSDQPAQMEWTPPPAPEAGWQNQPMGQDTPFQPPPAGGGLNQTLPIVSLVFGILSVCCWIAPLTGIVALITGFLGMKNVNNDPNNYGGKGLAIAGMIVGGVFFLLGVVYYILYIVGIAAGTLGRF